MRDATALTAKAASGRCSVTRASTSRAGTCVVAAGRAETPAAGATGCRETEARDRRVAWARDGLTSPFSAASGPDGTPFSARTRPDLSTSAQGPPGDAEAAGENPAGTCPWGVREDGGGVDYQHLSTLLWREQELLDLLLFKAEEKQYLIVTGKTRWLSRIAHEIEVVLDQLRTLEVERAAATEVLAERLGVRSEEHTSELQSRQYLVCR